METCSHDFKGLEFIIKRCGLKEVQETPQFHGQASEIWKIILQTIAAILIIWPNSIGLLVSKEWILYSLSSCFLLFIFSSFFSRELSIQTPQSMANSLACFLLIYFYQHSFILFFSAPNPLGNHTHFCLMYISCFVCVLVK